MMFAVWARKLDFELIGMFVVGMPGETRDEIHQTLKFAENHEEIDYTVFSIATPMIGTKMTKKLVANGNIQDVNKVNKVIKRTVGLYRTDEFSELDLGLIRAYDWDRINFSSEEKKQKYCKMVGINNMELQLMRNHSIDTFKRFYPDFNGPKSFNDMVFQQDTASQYVPSI